MKNIIVAGVMLFNPLISETPEIVNTQAIDVQGQVAKSPKSRRKAREEEEKKNKKRGPAGPAGAQGVDVTATGYIHLYSEEQQSVAGPSNSFNSVFFEVAGVADLTWEYDLLTGEFTNQESGIYLVEYHAHVHGPAGQNVNPPSYLPEGPVGIGPTFEFVAALDGVNVPGSHAGVILEASGVNTQQVTARFIIDYPGGAALTIRWAPSYGPEGTYAITPVNYAGTGHAGSAELTIIRLK